MRRVIFLMFVLLFAVSVVSCGEDPPPVQTVDNDLANTGSDIDTGNTGNTGDTGNTGNTGDTASDDDAGNTGDTGNSGVDCDEGNIGTNCSLDSECGKCNICVKGTCAKGCTSDEDCKMYTGLKCNKKLYRCTNVYASLQACGETKCPTGCCYAEAGLTGVKCMTTPDASKCGLCANGELYMPDDSKCVPAVCSTTSDNCPSLNSTSTDPKPECFECKSGEFVCKEDTTCGSSGVLVNAAQCIPAGQKCVAGVSECCSGMPCVEGYCY